MAEVSGLSKSAVKRAMIRGAVWYKKKGGKERRLRTATFAVHPGDQLSMYYDESILSQKAPVAHCQKDFQLYSIWYKPAGLMTQGTRYGDHCALTRQIERHFSPRRRVFVIHRIDRETAGLVIVGHSREAAARISEMFKRREIVKYYDAWVQGNLKLRADRGEINFPIDGRRAQTHYRLIDYDADMDRSHVSVRLITGRLHQIRRHFDMLGYPVVGDPRYGKGNKNSTGLKLVAKALQFDCPFGNGPVKIEINPNVPTLG